MKLSKVELLEKVKNYIGDRTDDESIEIIEDISDSFDTETENVEEVKSEYEEKLKTLDETWRKKYTDRFFSNPTPEDREEEEEHGEEEEKTEYSELFTEKEDE